MLLLHVVGEAIARKRKALGFTQSMLAKKANVGLSTLDALENARIGELGFTKISRLLAALGMEFTLHEVTARRPTLDDLRNEDLRNEDDHDQGLDRRN